MFAGHLELFHHLDEPLRARVASVLGMVETRQPLLLLSGVADHNVRDFVEAFPFRLGPGNAFLE